MRRLVFATSAAFLALAAGAARAQSAAAGDASHGVRPPSPADDKAACFDAASQAQSLRDAHKLVAAREAARRCASQTCPAQVQKDCAGWLDDIEKSLPTLVITAKDEAGRDLVDVTVTMDGQPFLTKLSGDALPVDPGAHRLHFETAGGAKLDQQVVLAEGVKDQRTAVVIPTGAPAPAPASAPGSASAPAPALGSVTGTAPAPAPAPEHGSTWRTVGYVAGAAGIVGVGVGAVFGFKAMSDLHAPNCDASKACDPGALSDAHTSAAVADAGIIAGSVLLAAGVALVLWAPRGEATAVRVTPALASGGGGVAAGGSW